MSPIDLSTKSKTVSTIAVSTALVVVLDSTPIIPGFYSGVWDSWLFLLSPLIGIVLGPVLGAVSVGFGGFLGHLIYFRDPYELVFMLGAPLGTLMAGLVYQERWKPVLTIYSLLLLGYSLSPVAWALPLWGIWDILLGYCFVILFTIITTSKINDHMSISKERKTLFALIFAIVIGLESDILLRVFIFVPCMTFSLFYGLTIEQLQLIWMGAGFITPLKVMLATIIGVTVGKALLKTKMFEQ